MLLRVRSRDGLERVQVQDTGTVATLKSAIEQDLGVPLQEQTLSCNQGLLLSKTPEEFRDMSNESALLSSLGLQNGAIVYLKYSGERQVVGQIPKVTPAGAFGRKMTIDDMIAKQTRIERQEKGHCELLSFDRDAANQFQLYVNESLAFAVKRGGFMYGKITEEGEVMVDFIYEPPQQGTEEQLHLFRNKDEEKRVDTIAAGLGMRKVGFIFTQSVGHQSDDYTMSNMEIRLAAELHAETPADLASTSVGSDSQVPRATSASGQGSGSADGVDRKTEAFELLKYFTIAIVKLEVGEDGAADVHFEAFQLSDQCLKLFRDGWFVDSPETEPKLSKMKQEVMVLRKDTTVVDNDFFLVPVKIGDHEGPLLCSFPVENRQMPQTQQSIRSHMEKYRSKPYVERLADFHLLLYLSQILDVTHDIPILANAVRYKTSVPDGYQLIIDHL